MTPELQGSDAVRTEGKASKDGKNSFKLFHSIMSYVKCVFTLVINRKFDQSERDC